MRLFVNGRGRAVRWHDPHPGDHGHERHALPIHGHERPHRRHGCARGHAHGHDRGYADGYGLYRRGDVHGRVRDDDRDCDCVGVSRRS